MRHYNFTLSRPGLKPGHHVPLRLRIVDTLTVLGGVPMLIAAIGVSMVSLTWADKLGLGVIWKNPFAFYGYVTIVIFVAIGTLYFRYIVLLRAFFRCLGMLTRQEAIDYPLEAFKRRRLSPWPESWQKPDDCSGVAETGHLTNHST